MEKMLIQGDNLKLLASMSIGMRVKFLRNKWGQLRGEDLSIAELAEKVDVKPQTLSSVERGIIVSPSYKAISNLAKVFHVPLEVFDDDYYLKNPKPFYIKLAVDSNQESEEKNSSVEAKWEEVEEEPRNKIGALYYQVSEDKTIKFIEHFVSQDWVDSASMIQLLARSNFEFKLLNTRSAANSAIFIQETIGSYNDVYTRYLKQDYEKNQLFPKYLESSFKKYFKTHEL